MEIMYKISVLTLQGIKLNFTVDYYEITEGGFVEFTDYVTKKRKKFHASRCEIEEVQA